MPSARRVDGANRAVQVAQAVFAAAEESRSAAAMRASDAATAPVSRPWFPRAGGASVETRAGTYALPAFLRLDGASVVPLLARIREDPTLRANAAPAENTEENENDATETHASRRVSADRVTP